MQLVVGTNPVLHVVAGAVEVWQIVLRILEVEHFEGGFGQQY